MSGSVRPTETTETVVVVAAVVFPLPHLDKVKGISNSSVNRTR